MDKKLLYVGLLFPIISYTQQPSVAEEMPLESESAPQEAEEQKAAEASSEIIETQPAVAESMQVDLDADDSSDDSQADTLDTQENDEDEDIDSNDTDMFESPEYARGNWYKKQQTLKHAHDVYQEVRQKEALVEQFENVFITKKNVLTNKFEEFSQALGGAINTIYQTLFEEIERLETSQKPEGQLTQQDRVNMAQAQETKESLLQLKKDFDALTELYKGVDKAMSVLMEQITISHNFEQKAFDSYEKIAQVLSDQVAEQLYAEIIAARENIIGISEYIKGDFSHYFDELSENITKSMALIQQQLTTLKERGVDLLKAKEERASHVETPEKKELPAAPGFFGGILLKIKNFFSAIIAWFKGFFA